MCSLQSVSHSCLGIPSLILINALAIDFLVLEMSSVIFITMEIDSATGNLLSCTVDKQVLDIVI